MRIDVVGKRKGVAKAKAQGLFKGRQEDTERNAGIASRSRPARRGAAYRPLPAAAVPPLPRSRAVEGRSIAGLDCRSNQRPAIGRAFHVDHLRLSPDCAAPSGVPLAVDA